MLGLALEGGGAKGAYEIGAYRALTELGYRFDVICGVSIGAINAALLAQGDCERAAEFWETMSNDDLFSEKDRGFLEVINRQVNLNTLSALKANIKTALENGGIDTSRIRAFLEQNIDPRRLLDSPVDYGMIAVAFPELQPLIAYKKDMTPETVIDHVLASASFPGFQPTVIGDKKYLDGGLYDACPYNALLDYGCDEVIAIRLNGFGIIHPVRDRSKIRQIFPSEQLGPVMRFDPANSRRNIQMGYYDTLRQLQGLPGRMYYFSQKADGFAVFAALPDDAIRTVAAPPCPVRAYPARYCRRAAAAQGCRLRRPAAGPAGAPCRAVRGRAVPVVHPRRAASHHRRAIPPAAGGAPPPPAALPPGGGRRAAGCGAARPGIISGFDALFSPFCPYFVR